MARLGLGAVAALVFVLALGVHVAAALSVDVEARFPGVWWLQGAAIIPLVLSVMLSFRGYGARPRLREIAAMLPAWGWAAIAATLLYAIGSLVWLLPTTAAGDPVVRGSSFFFNDHGAMRPVSGEAFHAQRAAVLRLYSAVWLYLALTATLLALAARRPPQPVPPAAGAV
jgi:hypothetical protein